MSKVRLRAVPTPAIPDRAARMSTLDEICRRKPNWSKRPSSLRSMSFWGASPAFRLRARPATETAMKKAERSATAARG
jgi:hypothetical protein